MACFLFLISLLPFLLLLSLFGLRDESWKVAGALCDLSFSCWIYNRGLLWLCFCGVFRMPPYTWWSDSVLFADLFCWHPRVSSLTFPSFLLLAVYFQLSLLKWAVGGVGHGRGEGWAGWENCWAEDPICIPWILEKFSILFRNREH